MGDLQEEEVVADRRAEVLPVRCEVVNAVDLVDRQGVVVAQEECEAAVILAVCEATDRVETLEVEGVEWTEEVPVVRCVADEVVLSRREVAPPLISVLPPVDPRPVQYRHQDRLPVRLKGERLLVDLLLVIWQRKEGVTNRVHLALMVIRMHLRHNTHRMRRRLLIMRHLSLHLTAKHPPLIRVTTVEATVRRRHIHKVVEAVATAVVTVSLRMTLAYLVTMVLVIHQRLILDHTLLLQVMVLRTIHTNRLIQVVDMLQ